MVDQIVGLFGGIPEGFYREKINTPSKSQVYFDTFHKPMIERVIARNRGKPINLLCVAPGHGYELDFLKDNQNVNLYGLDISLKVLSDSTKKRLPDVGLIAADVRNSPIKVESMDAVIAVNAVVYAPEYMLKVVYDSLKKDSEAVVNFRDYNNSYNKAFYKFYLADGGKVYDQIMTFNSQSFTLKVLDYRSCRDEIIRNLDRQIYFQGKKDIEMVINALGFKIIEHKPFHFKSFANSDNEMDVYLLKK